MFFLKIYLGFNFISFIEISQIKKVYLKIVLIILCSQACCSPCANRILNINPCIQSTSTHYRAYCDIPSFLFGRRQNRKKETAEKMSTLSRTKPYSDNQIKLDFVAEVAGNSIRSPLLKQGGMGKIASLPLGLPYWQS